MRKIRVARFKLYNEDVYSINCETIADMVYIAKRDLNFNNIFDGKKVNKTNLLDLISNKLKEEEYINHGWTGTLIIKCTDFHDIFGKQVDVVDIDIIDNYPSFNTGCDVISKLSTKKNYMSNEIFSFFTKCENCGSIIFTPIECLGMKDMKGKCFCNCSITIEKINEVRVKESERRHKTIIDKKASEEQQYISSYCDDARAMFKLHGITSPIEMSVIDKLIGIDFIKIIPQYNVDDKYYIDIMVQDLNGCNLFGIECDGYEWHSTKEQMINDYSRERYLKMKDIELVRFMGSEIHNDLGSCIEYILKYARKKLNNAH